jgi:aminopeptidase N
MKRRLDYRPPSFLIPGIELTFELDPKKTIVTATLSYVRSRDAGHDAPMTLDGDASLKLLSVTLNGATLSPEQYKVSKNALTILNVGDEGSLTIVTEIAPIDNTALEGLYVSSGVFCTQNEAEGFRRITFFPDRPDVLTRFSTSLIAHEKTYPVLLSNGNLVEQRKLPGGRHFARWEDPFPKPCYLFALVAGKLECIEDKFKTMSGRDVLLQIYATKNNIDKCDYAMGALKRAMKWDEEKYRREYDLDRFMIFCADDFNMGAMENKGLNIFNTALVLADPQTATDDDYHSIESVIGHEYFHNWTGDRITCRDWFQLSLKEGLTVFRDQQFSSDMGSAASERIAMVDVLRRRQFPEDAGPTAHPVRPDEYQAINNFYTMTVYEKGAEVIRMQHTLLGESAFQRGMDLYFNRHDGQAVTCDDFVAAMQDASEVDMTQFKRWYAQAGTPVVTATRNYNEKTQTYVLSLAQMTPPTPGQPEKLPLVIPVDTALLGGNGKPLPLISADDDAADARTAPTHRVLVLRDPQQTFRFRLPDGENGDDITPSLFRGGSAPVRLSLNYSDDELAKIARHETDPVARWDALQRCFTTALVNAATVGASLPEHLLSLTTDFLRDDDSDPFLRALAISLPELSAIADDFVPFNANAFIAARRRLERQLSADLHEHWLVVYDELSSSKTPYEPDAYQSGRRKLKAVALRFACLAGDEAAIARAALCFDNADNMTDIMAALTALRDVDCPTRTRLYHDFEERYRGNALALDKWFALQATSTLPFAVARVQELMRHEAFSIKNPNRVRAVMGSFALRNFPAFHASDGSGYRLVGQWVGELDALNPHSAAMLVNAFRICRKLADPQREDAMTTLFELRHRRHSPEVTELLGKLTNT